MSEQQQVFVRCLRVGEISPRMLAPHWTEMPCAKCRCRLYVAKSSRELIEKSGARPICAPCAETIDYIHVPHTEAQKAELLEHQRRIHNN